jgi:hypothetical protein
MREMYDSERDIGSNFNEANLNTIVHLSSMQPFLGQSTSQMQQTPMVCDAAHENSILQGRGIMKKLQTPNVPYP